VIEQPVKALGLGKIIFRTVDDVLGPPPALEEKKEK
jgi:hypothetical protein